MYGWFPFFVDCASVFSHIHTQNFVFMNRVDDETVWAVFK